MIIQSRRKFITGLMGLVAAPAVVTASNLMPVKSFSEELAREQLERLINERLKKAQEAIMREMTRNLFSAQIYDADAIARGLINAAGGDQGMLVSSGGDSGRSHSYVEIGYPIKIVRKS